MAMPVLSSFAQRLYDELQPLQFAEADNDYALAKFCASLGEMFQIVDDLGRDNDLGESGWEILLDVLRTPGYALPWLGQFIGVPVDTSLSDTDQRAQILAAGGWQRGTRAAMEAAALPYLIGAKNLLFRERDSDPYVLTVITYTAETPDSSKVEAALMAQKPAGILLNYQVFLGQTYQQLLTNRVNYSTVFSTYANYQLLATDLGTYTPPPGSYPAGSYSADAYGAGVYPGTPNVILVSKATGLAKLNLSAPGSAPTISKGVTLRVRSKKINVADSGLLRVWLYQGSTLIEGPFVIPLTSAFATSEFGITNAAAITDWSQLHVELQGVSDVGQDLTAAVSFIELQTTV